MTEQPILPRNNNKKILVTIILIVLVVIGIGIVIGITGVLIGVGVPAWKSTVKAGNETSAVQSITMIRTSQARYASKHQGIFALNFDELIKTGLDDIFIGEQPVVNGYIFTMKVEQPFNGKSAFYTINADPQISEGMQSTGVRHFYIDSVSSSIKFTEENRPAKAEDPSM